MTKKEALRLAHQTAALTALGFTLNEADSLRRISMTLHRWHELECGDEYGSIERDEKTGRPYWHSATRSGQINTPHFIPDRERGALKRLAKIIAQRNNRENALGATYQHYTGRLSYFIQGDPRGAALYILRPSDVPTGADPSAYYSRGICVY